MTFMQGTLAQADLGVPVAQNESEIRQFIDPGYDGVIWQRALPGAFHDWLNAMPAAQLPRGRVLIAHDAAKEAMQQFCREAKTPENKHRDTLISDVVELVTTFSELLDARFVRLRLDVVTTNACRKFHMDAIRARLVCTYRGTGTQVGVQTGNADPAQIHTVPTGSPILLRGSLWPCTPPSGLRHRSPPIEGTGETRLVLVIDPERNA